MKFLPLPREKRRLLDPLGRTALTCLLTAGSFGGLCAPLPLALTAAAGPGLPGLCCVLGCGAGAFLFLPFQAGLRQLAAAILFIVLLRNSGILSPNLYVPFFGVEWKLPWVVYMIFAALVITGTVNAVNITDGVDGLSSSVTLPVCAFFAASFGYAYLHWDRPGSAGMTVFAAALFGGLVGFLVYNFYPAKVFMGDTGSLFLGGAVCGMAFALDLPLILILVGIIYIVETLSDIIQIVYFKATHGKRIFRMAPLHHHLEMGGWSEKKVVFVFAGISLVFCILAFFGVIGRFPVL